MSRMPPRRYGPPTPARKIAVKADDGCELNVRVLREAQTPTAVPVVFMHALAMDGDMWQGVVDALGGPDGADNGRAGLYAMDCRGHGASDASAGDFTVERFAKDLGHVLDALGANRAHIVGCSMGGTVALGFAGRYPARVASLTVIDATAWYGPEAPANWEKRARAAAADGMSSLVDFQLARWFSPAFLQAQVELVQASVDVFVANRVPAYASSCRMLGQADERAALIHYTGPAAVVVGEEDYATPPDMAEDIASRLSGAKLTVIPGTRHYTPLEAPVLVATCIGEAIHRAGTEPAH